MRNEATSETSCETCMWLATLINADYELRSSFAKDKVKIILMINFSSSFFQLIYIHQTKFQDSSLKAGDSRIRFRFLTPKCFNWIRRALGQ